MALIEARDLFLTLSVLGVKTSLGACILYPSPSRFSFLLRHSWRRAGDNFSEDADGENGGPPAEQMQQQQERGRHWIDISN